MSAFTITTNNTPRLLLSSFDLTEAELRDFDWIDSDDLDSVSFVRYCGVAYATGDFMSLRGVDEFDGWHGYHGDSYFSGVLIRFCEDGDSVIMGRYVS